MLTIEEYIARRKMSCSYCMVLTANLEMHHMIATQGLLKSFGSSRIKQKYYFFLLKTITGFRVSSGLALGYQYPIGIKVE